MQSMPWLCFDEFGIFGQARVAQPMTYHNMPVHGIVHQPPYAGMRGGVQFGTEETDHQDPLMFFTGHGVRQCNPAFCILTNIAH